MSQIAARTTPALMLALKFEGRSRHPHGTVTR
jgi:hypothetical protein